MSSKKWKPAIPRGRVSEAGGGRAEMMPAGSARARAAYSLFHADDRVNSLRECRCTVLPFSMPPGIRMLERGPGCGLFHQRLNFGIPSVRGLWQTRLILRNFFPGGGF